jgi:hypothetical protein
VGKQTQQRPKFPEMWGRLNTGPNVKAILDAHAPSDNTQKPTPANLKRLVTSHLLQFWAKAKYKGATADENTWFRKSYGKDDDPQILEIPGNVSRQQLKTVLDQVRGERDAIRAAFDRADMTKDDLTVLNVAGRVRRDDVREGRAPASRGAPRK